MCTSNATPAMLLHATSCVDKFFAYLNNENIFILNNNDLFQIYKVNFNMDSHSDRRVFQRCK